jgi:hypothetical protein
MLLFKVDDPVIVTDDETGDELDGYVVGVTSDEWLVYEVLTVHDDRVRAVSESLMQRANYNG